MDKTINTSAPIPSLNVQQYPKFNLRKLFEDGSFIRFEEYILGLHPKGMSTALNTIGAESF